MCKLKKIRCDGAMRCVNCRRHNQECQYMLSKKRQPSKKSVGSVSSEKHPESRSQLDDTVNTAADVLIEAPFGAQTSPGMNFSSNGAANSLTNGSPNSLQGASSLSDDQNTVRTLPENASWSVETDEDGSHNLPPAPPPTDMSNVPDANAFFWPLFTTDNDWQFDFDIPFNTEHASAPTDASSTTLTDLDMSQFYNRPTQGFDSAGCSRELIEYLSVSEKKCPTRSFLDPVPSINYSIKAIFSAQDRGLDNISSTKQDEIDRIFKRMSLVQAQLSLVDIGDGQCHDGYASWYRNDAALMESCRAACFQRPVG